MLKSKERTNVISALGKAVSVSFSCEECFGTFPCRALAKIHDAFPCFKQNVIFSRRLTDI